MLWKVNQQCIKCHKLMGEKFNNAISRADNISAPKVKDPIIIIVWRLSIRVVGDEYLIP